MRMSMNEGTCTCMCLHACVYEYVVWQQQMLARQRLRVCMGMHEGRVGTCVNVRIVAAAVACKAGAACVHLGACMCAHVYGTCGVAVAAAVGRPQIFKNKLGNNRCLQQ